MLGAHRRDERAAILGGHELGQLALRHHEGHLRTQLVEARRRARHVGLVGGDHRSARARPRQPRLVEVELLSEGAQLLVGRQGRAEV